MKRYTFFFCLIFFIPVFLYAQSDIDVFASLDKTQVEVGQEVILTVIIKQKTGSGSIELGNLTYPAIPDFIQKGTSNTTYVTSVNGQAQAISEFQRTLVPTSDGTFTIGAVSVSYQDAATGAVRVLQSEPIALTVVKQKRSAEKSEQIQQNKKSAGDVSPKKKKRGGVGVSEIAAVLLIAGIGYIYYHQKRTAGNRVADERAPKRLAIELPCIDDENFCDALSSALKEHIAQKHGISAGKNTQEILNSLKTRSFLHYNEIKEVLETCDRARFARMEVDKDRLMEIAKKIIS